MEFNVIYRQKYDKTWISISRDREYEYKSIDIDLYELSDDRKSFILKEPCHLEEIEEEPKDDETQEMMEQTYTFMMLDSDGNVKLNTTIEIEGETKQCDSEGKFTVSAMVPKTNIVATPI